MAKHSCSLTSNIHRQHFYIWKIQSTVNLKISSLLQNKYIHHYSVSPTHLKKNKTDPTHLIKKNKI